MENSLQSDLIYPMLNDVDRIDRPMMRKLIFVLLTFDESLPKLKWDFKPKESHYNVLVKGWIEQIQFKRWYNTFESENRNKECDCVISTSIIPSPESGGRPIITLKVDRTDFSVDAKRSTVTKKKKNKKRR
ncbi:hypothetical protein OAB94_02180 [Flavobacteriaceae bacterium]|nr:hypothetical protein [Flavobacteriaceae bacterium]